MEAVLCDANLQMTESSVLYRHVVNVQRVVTLFLPCHVD
jgi:hypothetical protein